MPEGTVTLTKRELDRVVVLQTVINRKITQMEAALALGLGVRQVKRLIRRMRTKGEAALTSLRRGQPSNRRLKPDLRSQIESLLQDKYPDFGPTLAREKLVEIHGLHVSVETIRRIQSELGLWRPKRRKAVRNHQMRERRPRRGELVQIDGSPHAWFEERGERCTLIVFIDDATGTLLALRFAPTETTEAYMLTLHEYMKQHGCPVALYSDKHSIFRLTKEDPANGNTTTQFGRALVELDIEAIHAHSPQAKGRVERANQTLQDRLVKELRLQGISDMASANGRCQGRCRIFMPRFPLPSLLSDDLISLG
jgi:transposase